MAKLGSCCRALKADLISPEVFVDQFETLSDADNSLVCSPYGIQQQVGKKDLENGSFNSSDKSFFP